MNTVSGKEYVHTEAVDLVSTAIDQTANTLAFVDLTKVYVGQETATFFESELF